MRIPAGGRLGYMTRDVENTLMGLGYTEEGLGYTETGRQEYTGKTPGYSETIRQKALGYTLEVMVRL